MSAVSKTFWLPVPNTPAFTWLINQASASGVPICQGSSAVPSPAGVSAAPSVRSKLPFATAAPTAAQSSYSTAGGCAGVEARVRVRAVSPTTQVTEPERMLPGRQAAGSGTAFPAGVRVSPPLTLQVRATSSIACGSTISRAGPAAKASLSAVSSGKKAATAAALEHSANRSFSCCAK